MAKPCILFFRSQLDELLEELEEGKKELMTDYDTVGPQRKFHPEVTTLHVHTFELLKGYRTFLHKVPNNYLVLPY